MSLKGRRSFREVLFAAHDVMIVFKIFFGKMGRNLALVFNWNNIMLPKFVTKNLNRRNVEQRVLECVSVYIIVMIS